MSEQISLFDAIAPETPDEYNAFIDKFKPKKTTDDCYTPDLVYAAVAGFVRKNYGLEGAEFIRPFFPGGDYERHKYPPGSVVVDNPPFSILSKIVAFYNAHGVAFFLFAPALTLFGGKGHRKCAALPVGADVTFDNGATISISFLTNLEPENVQVKTYPELYRAVMAAVAQIRSVRALPRYEYPDEILTAAMAQRWCKYGVEYTLRSEDCIRVPALDAQRAAGKSIFGGGYLLSTRAAAERAAAERAAAERAAAERAAAERAAAERYALSDRERYISEHLEKDEIE